MIQDVITRTDLERTIVSGTTPQEIQREALRLLRLGLSIIPVKANKIAAVEWKRYQNERADEKQIREWWKKPNEWGIGIVLGDVSGELIARDFDDHDSYNRWQDAFPTHANELPTVQTSRGFHVYARSSSCATKAFDIGELRGNGAYVVAPPSKNSSGGNYLWIRPFQGLEEIPTYPINELGFDKDWAIYNTDMTDAADSSDKTEITDKTDKTHTDSVRSALSDRSALSVSIDSQLRSFVKSTQPLTGGTRHKKLFSLARKIWSDPNTRGLGLPKLKPYLEEWHRLALPVISTKDFDETWADFVDAYKNVDPNRCTDATLLARKRAETNELPPEALRYESQLCRRLVALCFELSRSAPDGVFYLSCRQASDVLEVGDHNRMNRMLNMLHADMVLDIVEVGSRDTNRATRYRYRSR